MIILNVTRKICFKIIGILKIQAEGCMDGFRSIRRGESF